MGPEAALYVPSLATLPAHLMDGVEGRDRLRRLAFNCRYFSGGLKKLGFIVYGHRDSPIVPMLIYAPGKMGPFSRLMLERHRIIVVIVGKSCSLLSLILNFANFSFTLFRIPRDSSSLLASTILSFLGSY